MKDINIDNENFTEYNILRSVKFVEGKIELVRSHVVINGRTSYNDSKTFIFVYDNQSNLVTDPFESGLKKFHEFVGKYIVEYGWRSL